MTELDSRALKTEFIMICDVESPLLGRDGAARVFAPQKGVSQDDVRTLENGLRNIADIIKKGTGKDINISGGGAAGGVSAVLYGLLNAKLKKGIDTVIDLLDITKKIKDADLVFTGEGRVDNQTAFGKAPAGIAALAKRHNIPCIAIAGAVGENIEKLYELGMISIFPVCKGPVTMHESIRKAKNSAGSYKR